MAQRMKRFGFGAWIASAVALLTLAPAAAAAGATTNGNLAQGRQDPAVVRTDRGLVRGSVAVDHRTFRAIPYAAPPVGALRWRSPRPAERWTGVRDATRPRPGCTQLDGLPMDTVSNEEDCLHLTVTTPRRSARDRLPVIVWFHGGHFLLGQGDAYGGRTLAVEGDVIVVTPNYRLGPLGFLAHPAIEETPGASGNFGIEDQQAALRWVRDNAAAFGGDPGNVTIAGQSAGATSVCAHLAAPGSGGLFHRAIVQSNACTTPLRTREESLASGAAFVGAAECDLHPQGVAACLRGRSASSLVTVAGYPGMSDWEAAPTAGGPVLPVDPAEAVTTGRVHRVPVLVGSTRDEYRGQIWGMERSDMLCASEQPKPCGLSWTQFLEQVTAAFGAGTPAVLARYPRAAYATASEALGAVMTDAGYARPIHDTALALARHMPTYAYEFADRDAPYFIDEVPTTFPMGSYHLAELPYLFAVTYAHPLNARQGLLSDALVGYWSRFAHAGDPNRRGLPTWHRFTTHDRYVQGLAPGRDGIGRTDFETSHQLTFWRSLEH
jgi:para-nitrobenzyl esterase